MESPDEAEIVSPFPVVDGDDDEMNNISLSLCGQYLNQEFIQQNRLTEVDLHEIFMEYQITYDDYCSDPKAILANQNLVVGIEGLYYGY